MVWKNDGHHDKSGQQDFRTISASKNCWLTANSSQSVQMEFSFNQSKSGTSGFKTKTCDRETVPLSCINFIPIYHKLNSFSAGKAILNRFNQSLKVVYLFSFVCWFRSLSIIRTTQTVLSIYAKVIGVSRRIQLPFVISELLERRPSLCPQQHI